MSKLRATPGPWKAFNMVHAETGERMTPDQVGEYVANSIRKRPECDDFLFISAVKPDGGYDVCLIGNGEDGPFNALLIESAPEMAELIETMAHIGIDFGYGEFQLSQEHIDKARAIWERLIAA